MCTDILLTDNNMRFTIWYYPKYYKPWVDSCMLAAAELKSGFTAQILNEPLDGKIKFKMKLMHHLKLILTVMNSYRVQIH